MATVLDKDYPSNAEDQLRALKQLLASNIINDDQYNALKEEDGLDLDKVAWQLKQVKIGRGVSFLPRITNGLFDRFKDYIASYADEKSGQLRDKVLAVLDELLQRKAISKKEYKDKIEQHDIY